MKRPANLRPLFYLVAVTLTMFCLLNPGPAFADPPQDVALSYDNAKQTLTVSVTHNTTFSRLHYVKQIDIRKNGMPVSSYQFKSQPDKKTFTETYEVPAEAGDVLEAIANCNLQGNKSATLTVGKTTP
jgi:desulfoferrodoxin (superoxide reductase-like protein)